MRVGDLILYWDWDEELGRKSRFPAVVVRLWGHHTIEWYDCGEFGTSHVSDIIVLNESR